MQVYDAGFQVSYRGAAIAIVGGIMQSVSIERITDGGCRVGRVTVAFNAVGTALNSSITCPCDGSAACQLRTSSYTATNTSFTNYINMSGGVLAEEFTRL